MVFVLEEHNPLRQVFVSVALSWLYLNILVRLTAVEDCVFFIFFISRLVVSGKERDPKRTISYLKGLIGAWEFCVS